MDLVKRRRFLKSILTAKEFNEIRRDEDTYKEAIKMYDEQYIDSVHVIAVNGKRFVVPIEDMPKLHKDWKRILGEISLKEILINPIYVQVESDGTMLVE